LGEIGFSHDRHALSNLTLCQGFRARLKILAEAFAVDAGVELKNDIPGWIREL
jgi:hypothetical protein